MRQLMKFASLASFLTYAALAAGCAGALQQGKPMLLKPSMVSADFKDLDKENPFAAPKTKVDTLKVGIAQYDSFFLESAKIRGTVVLADVVLKETDSFIADSKKRIAGGKGLSPPQVKAVAEHQKRLGALTELLGSLPDRASKLVETGTGLGKGAAKTFVGPNALKLPGVVKGLDESRKDLEDSAKRAPKLLDHATKTAGELTSLK